MDKADNIGAHAQPIVTGQLQLPDGACDTTVAKDVVICCLDDGDLFDG